MGDTKKLNLVYEALTNNAILDSTRVDFDTFQKKIKERPETRKLVYNTLVSNKILDSARVPFEEFEVGITNEVPKDSINEFLREVSPIPLNMIENPKEELANWMINSTMSIRNLGGTAEFIANSMSQLFNFASGVAETGAEVAESLGGTDYAKSAQKNADFFKKLAEKSKTQIIDREGKYKSNVIPFVNATGIATDSPYMQINDVVNEGITSTLMFAPLALASPIAAATFEAALEAGGVNEELSAKEVPQSERLQKMWVDFGLNLPIIWGSNKFGMLNDKLANKLVRSIVSSQLESGQEFFQEGLSAELANRKLTGWDLAKIWIGTTFSSGLFTGVGLAANPEAFDVYKKHATKAIDDAEKTGEYTKEEAAEARESVKKITPQQFEEFQDLFKDEVNQQKFEEIPKGILSDPNFEVLKKKVADPSLSELEQNVQTWSTMKKMKNKGLEKSRELVQSEVAEQLKSSTQSGKPINLSLKNILGKTRGNRILSSIEQREDFIKLQQKSTAPKLSNKKAEAHSKLYAQNPSIYSNEIYGLLVEESLQGNELDEVNSSFIEEPSESITKPRKVKPRASNEATEQTTTNKEIQSDEEDQEKRKEVLIDEKDFPPIFQEGDYTQDSNFKYPDWMDDVQREVSNKYFRVDRTKGKSSPKYPFKKNGKFDNIVNLMKEINTKYGNGNYGDVVLWDTGLKSIVFSTKPKYKNEQLAIFGKENIAMEKQILYQENPSKQMLDIQNKFTKEYISNMPVLLAGGTGKGMVRGVEVFGNPETSKEELVFLYDSKNSEANQINLEYAKKIADEKNIPIYSEKENTIIYFSEKVQNILTPKSVDTAKNLIEQFRQNEIADEKIQPFADFIFDRIENEKLRFVNPDQYLGGQKIGTNKGAYWRNTLYLNSSLGLEESYNTLVHEGIHYVSASALDPNSKNYNREFRIAVEEIHTNLMNKLKGSEFADFVNQEDVKQELKRITYDAGLIGTDLSEAKTKAMKEFVAYMLSNTAPKMYEFAKTHYVSRNTTFLQKFLDEVKKFFKSLFKGSDADHVNYIQALEYTFSKFFDYKGSYSDLIMSEGSQLTSQSVESFGEVETSVASDEFSEVNLKNVLSGVTVGNDWYASAEKLSYPQFKKIFEENTKFNKSLELYYAKRKLNKTFEEFKDATIKKIYRLSNSLKKQKVAKLNIVFERDPLKKTLEVKSSSLEYMPDVYYNKDHSEQTSYKYKTILDQKLNVLNTIFATNLELVYLDEVKKFVPSQYGYNAYVSKISDKDTRNPKRNSFYSKIFKSHGIIFPGTFADKSTTVGFKGQLNNVDELISFYRNRIIEMLKVLVENEKFTQEQAQGYLQVPPDFEENKESYLLGTVLEDLRLGATTNEDGSINSVLFDPVDANTYNAIKMFKRPTDILPLHSVIMDPDYHNEVYNNLQDKTGIGLNEEGMLQFNTAIVSPNSETTFKVSFHGIELEVPINSILTNSYGTDNFDGVNVYSESFGKVLDHINGYYYNTPRKGKILNSYGKTPYYNKGAYFTTNSKVLKDWMKTNEIALLTFSSAIKVNRGYEETELFGKPQVFQLPFSDFYGDSEKKHATDEATGLMQSLTTFYNSKANPNYSYKDKEIVNSILNKLVDRFVGKMSMMDAPEAIKYLRDITVEGTNKQQTAVGKILSDYIYNEVSEKAKQSIADMYTAEQISNIFMEPYVSQTLQNYISKELHRIFKFKINSSWMTLRPDFGWLEEDNLEKVWDNVRESFEYDSRKKINDLIAEKKAIAEAIKVVPKDSIAEMQNLIEQEKEIEDKIEAEGDKDYSSDIKKKFEGIIDTRTGRLKKGWMYITDDINKVKNSFGENVFDVKHGDDIISTVIPGTDIGSQFAAKIAATLKLDQEGIVTHNSEYVQTKQGRDFDIDQLLILPYTSEWFTEKSYGEFVESVNKSVDKYLKNKKTEYERVLGRKLFESTSSEGFVAGRDESNLIDSDEVNVEYMQKITGSALKNSNTIFNPMNDSLFLKDLFLKDVGGIIVNNKIFTMQSQIGMTAEVSIAGKTYTLDASKGIKKYSYVASRLLHDNVDKPTNTNSFFYNFNDINMYDIVYDMGLIEDLKKKDIALDNPEVIKGIKAISEFNKWFSEKLTQLNTDSFGNTAKSIATIFDNIEFQRMINDRLKKGTSFNGVINVKVADISESPLIYLSELIDSSYVPGLSLHLTEYTNWQKAIVQKYLESPEYKKVVDRNLELNANYVKDFNETTELDGNTLHPEANTDLFAQFLATKDGEKDSNLHLLKAKLISLVNPTNQSIYKLSDENVSRFYKNVYDVANEYSFPKLMNLALKKRAITAKTTHADLTLPSGKTLRVSKGQNGGLLFAVTGVSTIFTNDDVLYGSRKLDAGLQRLLIGDEFTNIFSSKTDFTVNRNFNDETKRTRFNRDTAAKNRYDLNQFMLFTNNTDFAERVLMGKELLDKELPTFSDNEKDVFWKSLVGYPSGTISIPLNLIPPNTLNFSMDSFPTQDKLLELASTVNDPSGRKFLKEYIRIASQSFPYKNGFEQRINPIDSGYERPLFNEDLSASNEVYDEGISFEDNLNTIYSIINGPLFKEGKQKTISKDGTIALVYNFLGSRNRTIPLDRLAVTKAVSMFETNIASPAVSLAEVALTKFKYLQKSKSIFNTRIDILMNKINNNAKLLVKNSQAENIGQAYKMINELAEEMPIKMIIKEVSSDTYVLKVGGVEYSDHAELLRFLGITDVNQIAKFEAAINLRIIYDYWNPKITDNVLFFLRSRLDLSPHGFAYAENLNRLIAKWEKREAQFKARKGKYIPLSYTEEVHDKLVTIYGLYHELIKDGTPEELARTEARRLVEADQLKLNIPLYERVQRNKVVLHRYEGVIYQWELERKFPKWLTRGEAILDTLDIHDEHNKQFISEVVSDITRVDKWFYEHKSASMGENEKIRNMMIAWYNQVMQGTYRNTGKVSFDKLADGDNIVFRLKSSGASLKGVFDSQSDRYIYLKIDKDLYRENLQNKINNLTPVMTAIMNDPESENMTVSPKIRKIMQDFGMEVDSNMKMREALNRLRSTMETTLSNPSTWGRYPKSNIFVDQYQGGRAVQASGVEITRKSVKRIKEHNILGLKTPTSWNEFLHLSQKISSIFSLGTPGAAFKNLSESYWRTNQMVVFNGGTGEKRTMSNAWNFRNKFKDVLQNGGLDVYFNDARAALAMKDISKLPRDSGETGQLSKERVRDAIVVKYLFENELGRLDKNIGASYIPGQETEKHLNRVFGLRNFHEAEVINRVLGAYIFATKAIFVDNVSDVMSIENIIEKQVEEANSKYGLEVRSLAESSELGRLVMLFKQFNGYQWDLLRNNLKRARELGQTKPVFYKIFERTLAENINNAKYNLSNAMKAEITAMALDGTMHTYKRGASVDPLIPANMLRYFLMDVTAASFVEYITPGLRFGNPTNKIIGMLIGMFTNYVVTGEPPNEWSIREWIFNLLGFKLGVYGSLVPNLLWNLFTEEHAVIPVSSRQLSFAMDLYGYWDNSTGTASQKVASAKYMEQQTLKYLFGVDLTAHKRKYYSNFKNEIMSEFYPMRPYEIGRQITKGLF